MFSLLDLGTLREGGTGNLELYKIAINWGKDYNPS